MVGEGENGGIWGESGGLWVNGGEWWRWGIGYGGIWGENGGFRATVRGKGENAKGDGVGVERKG